MHHPKNQEMSLAHLILEYEPLCFLSQRDPLKSFNFPEVLSSSLRTVAISIICIPPTFWCLVIAFTYRYNNIITTCERILHFLWLASDANLSSRFTIKIKFSKPVEVTGVLRFLYYFTAP